MPTRKATLDERCAELRQRMTALKDAMKHRTKASPGLQLPAGQWSAWHVGADLSSTDGSVILLVRDGADTGQRARDHAHIILSACGAKSPWTQENWNVHSTNLPATQKPRQPRTKRPKAPGLHLVANASGSGVRAA